MVSKQKYREKTKKYLTVSLALKSIGAKQKRREKIMKAKEKMIMLMFIVTVSLVWAVDSRQVDISSFTATATEDNTIFISWTTETETNMLGYNLVRSEDYMLINAEMINPNIIEATNTSQPANYSFEDEEVLSGITYYYWLQIIDLELTIGHFGPVSAGFVGVNQEVMPTAVAVLRQNYPNPFNPETTIGFSLTTESAVTIEVFNIRGEKIAVLLNCNKPAGEHRIIWKGTDDNNLSVASGVYFYRLMTEDSVHIKRMLLAK